MKKHIEQYFHLFQNRVRALESSKILLMLSGGVDSMVLAHFLMRVKNEYSIDFACYHLNHNYRGLDADRDAEFVREFCIENDLKHFIESRNVPKIAEERKLGFEHCAREVRLGIAREIKEREGFDYIATAHHLDDSVESMVHNFIRGSSLQGLSGMAFINGDFVRPLIDLKKDDIMEIAAYFDIDFKEDATNFDTDFTRNLIRHSIIPKMLSVNPNFKNTVTKSAEQISEDKAYLDSVARRTLDAIKVKEGYMQYKTQNITVLDILAFRELDIAIKKRVLRLIIEEYKGNLVNVYSSIIDEIIVLTKNLHSGKRIIFKGIIFEISRDRMLITKEKVDEVDELRIKMGENHYNGARICVESLDFDVAVSYEKEHRNQENFIILPLSYMEEGLVLRRRKTGDLIRPARLKGKKKTLKKLFVDLKLSRIEKEAQVLLVHGEDVLSILGLEKIDNKEIIEHHQSEKFILIELLNL